MKSHIWAFQISLLICLLIASGVIAHAPLESGENESLETALEIPDPSKSWVIYSELHEGGEAQYFFFEVQEGDRIYVGLIKPVDSEESDFLPNFVLIGPGIQGNESLPEFIELPSDEEYGYTIIAGEQPEEASYEGFSPSSFYDLGDIDLNAPASGKYYIAVYEWTQGGNYGVVVGYRESYALSEWILLPFDLLNVYQWEGQNLLTILMPLLFTVVAGIIFFIWRFKKGKTPKTLHEWLGSLGALLILGTGANVLYQMGYTLTKTSLVSEIVITIFIAIVPILIAIGIFRILLKDSKEINMKKSIKLIVLGILAIFAWAGLLIGPILTIISGATPYLLKIISKVSSPSDR